jgi:hypothetical protein
MLVRWKPRADIAPLEHEIDALKTVVIQLRRQLTTKTNLANGLELALKERHTKIDSLNETINRLRAVNQRLDEEAEHYFRMLAAG